MLDAFAAILTRVGRRRYVMREESAGYAGRIDTDPDTDGDPEGDETQAATPDVRHLSR